MNHESHRNLLGKKYSGFNAQVEKLLFDKTYRFPTVNVGLREWEVRLFR